MAVSDLPLVVQTSYAELVDQLRLGVASRFPAGSTFRQRTIAGRSYWYAQEPTGPKGRPAERYVGPDTPDLAAAIGAAKSAKDNVDTRKVIVRTLKAAGAHEPDAMTGDLVEALAAAGVFRLRAVIVGTVAFQTYSGVLGVKLPGAAIRTADIAQDYGISVAVDDAIDLPFLEILQTVDRKFAPVPSLAAHNAAVAYATPKGYRVDLLTTNRGRDRDKPVPLKTLRSDAAPLRFLDFLLKDSIEAAVLTRSGVLVNVPAPARFAVHKLIVSTLRNRSGASAAKADKDVAQAGALIEALSVKRRVADLTEAQAEARSRGAEWRKRLDSGIQRLRDEQRTLLAR